MKPFFDGRGLLLPRLKLEGQVLIGGSALGQLGALLMRGGLQGALLGVESVLVLLLLAAVFAAQVSGNLPFLLLFRYRLQERFRHVQAVLGRCVAVSFDRCLDVLVVPLALVGVEQG